MSTSVCNTGTAAYTVTPAAESRLVEKESLKDINDRLTNYVRQVGELYPQ